MASITYHLVLLVLKLKGIKKTFSKAPIDFQKLRKEDIHLPSKKVLKGNTASQFTIKQSVVTELTPVSEPSSNVLILYCPGGAFVYGPTELSWNSIAYLVKATNTKAWVVDYPKAPEADIQEINANLDAVYAHALKDHQPTDIILLGDSVGAALHMTLLQRLVAKGEPAPAKLIAISPVMDASMTNPEIDTIDCLDPILSKPGVLSAKQLCAGVTDLQDPAISPLYGNFENFPETHLFLAKNDIMFPDEKVAVAKMREAQVPLHVIEGKGMPHIWPLLPIMHEAKVALNQIAQIILQSPLKKATNQSPTYKSKV